jgi:hypothetical protein
MSTAKVNSMLKKTKSHRHKFTRVVEWVRAPDAPHATSNHWYYTVMSMCDCGTTKQRDATYEEVETYVKAKTCSCGQFNADHKDQTSCIRELRDTVNRLEDRLDELMRKLRSLS